MGKALGMRLINIIKVRSSLKKREEIWSESHLPVASGTVTGDNIALSPEIRGLKIRVRDRVRERLFNSRLQASHYHNTYTRISSHELPSLPKTNMKSEGSGNATGLKFENRTRSQSRTLSPI